MSTYVVRYSRVYGCFLGLLPYSPTNSTAVSENGVEGNDEARGQNVRGGEPVRDKNRWIALYVLCVGMLMIVLDATVVNVALPAIQDDLQFSQSGLAWVVDAYLIAFGGLLLLAGRLGDLVSRKRVFLVGLGVFTVASLLCGVAQSQEILVGARFLQGAGGARAGGGGGGGCAGVCWGVGGGGGGGGGGRGGLRGREGPAGGAGAGAP